MSAVEVRKLAVSAVRVGQTVARQASNPKGCFLGITATGSLLLFLLASLSHS